MLVKWLVKPTYSETVNVFPLYFYIDERKVSVLHTAIMGVLPIELDQALRSSQFSEHVNARSVDGESLFGLAVTRSDIQTVKLFDPSRGRRRQPKQQPFVL